MSFLEFYEALARVAERLPISSKTNKNIEVDLFIELEKILIHFSKTICEQSFL